MAPSYKIPRNFKDTDRKIPDLPDELSENILSRLPAELLLEYKCVSKSWFALISSKRFVKIHLENLNKDNGLSHLGITSGSNYYLEHSSLQSLLREQSIEAIDLLLPHTSIYPHKNTRIVGCFNGLCCMITGGKYFSLLNPCMKQIKRLPDKYSRDGYVTRHGFGFDESNDDYKVFASIIRYDYGFFRPYKESHAKKYRYTKIYSLKTNSWKKIDYFDVGGSPVAERGIFSKGKLHWLITYRETRPNIAYFDLGSEIHGSLELPISLGDDNLMPPLGVLRECLCFLDSNNLWIYFQYGVKESWSKLVSFSYLGNPTYWNGNTPLYISPNGHEILLANELSFVIYYPRLGDYRLLQSNKFMHTKICTGLHACVHVNTLVSPFWFDEQRKQQNN